MRLHLTTLSALILTTSIATHAQQSLHIQPSGGTFEVIVKNGGRTVLSLPAGQHWAIATAWREDWPADWHYASPTTMEKSGDWQVVKGELDLPQGKWRLRDAYRTEPNGLIQCIRRYEWTGKTRLDSATLAIRWNMNAHHARAFLPGILYYGNPSGERNGREKVPVYHGATGEFAIFEEHRYPMPFACLEGAVDGQLFGAALHTQPSPAQYAVKRDLWWSLGVEETDAGSQLVMLSGPVAYNDQHSATKALQTQPMRYGDTWLNIQPGAIIEKTFYIETHPLTRAGTAFQRPVHTSIDLFKPFYAEDLPSFDEILQSKYRFAMSRWIEGDGYAGFNMYPAHVQPHIVMGWCGQAASPGYAFQRLKGRYQDPNLMDKVQRSLDFLAACPVGAEGFPVRFNIKNKTWDAPDHVSQGQAMYNFAKAIEAGRQNKQVNTKTWEDFLRKACDVHSRRVMPDNWRPLSTAEGFYIAPLAIAARLFRQKTYLQAAIRIAEHYAQRHLSMEEPYWGGTLDAECEDKEGAWAAFQGFLTLYEQTKEARFLEWARHAGDAALSYLVVWDIPLPPGRMADHQFKTRGWTVVSPQNQHIDVFGVMFAPEVYKLGVFTQDEQLKKAAIVMFRSCGQLTDPYGSQGEQLQQTNYAQHGEMDDVMKLRGGYSEPWTVFWITAHFLNTAARFEEMGVRF